MGRLGVGLDSLAAVCSTLKSSPHVVCEGLSPSGIFRNPRRTFSREQIANFESARGFVREAGLSQSSSTRQHRAVIAILKPGTPWCVQA